MPAVSRHLPRGLGQARFATLRSVSHLERNVSGLSRTVSRSIQDESSCSNLGYGGEFELLNFFTREINPPETSNVFELRSGRSRSTIIDRCLEYRPTPERQNVAVCGVDFSAEHHLRRTSFRVPCYTPSAWNSRSVSTAVSDEDELRPEVDDEELDLKVGDENLETISTKKRKGVVAEDAETSIYVSPEDSTRLTATDVNKYLKLRNGQGTCSTTNHTARGSNAERLGGEGRGAVSSSCQLCRSIKGGTQSG